MRLLFSVHVIINSYPVGIAASLHTGMSSLPIYIWAVRIKKGTPPEKSVKIQTCFGAKKKFTNQKFIYLRTPQKIGSSRNLLFQELWSFKKPANL